MLTSPLLTLVVALSCEAKPLIKKYGLKRVFSNTHFPYFQNEMQRISLVVTGVGKINTATVVGYLCHQVKSTSLLNVGIVGAKHAKLGEVVLANKLIDVSSRKNYYPHFTLLKKIKSTAVLTYDHPVSAYPPEGVVDMEASGFFKSGSQFIPQELLHCVKVVSDTYLEERDALTPKRVNSLIANALPEIEGVIQALMNLAKEEESQYVVTVETHEFFERWHFTEYQKHQLRGLLKRWGVLNSEENPFLACQAEKNAKAVLTLLDSALKVSAAV